MPVSYKRKNSMKKSKSSKGSKSSKLSKRVKTRKSTKPKKRLTRKSKNGSVVRKMKGGGKYDSVMKLLADIFPKKNGQSQNKRIKRIMSNIPETVKSNVDKFKIYFTEIIHFESRSGFDMQDLLDIKLYYIHEEVEKEEVAKEHVKAKQLNHKDLNNISVAVSSLVPSKNQTGKRTNTNNNNENHETGKLQKRSDVENWFFRNSAPAAPEAATNSKKPPPLPPKSQALKNAKEKQREEKAAQQREEKAAQQQQAELSAAPYTNTPQPGYSNNQNALMKALKKK